MSISTSLSFHGVSRVELGEISENTIGHRTWKSMTIWLYNKNDEECVSFSIHSPENSGLTVAKFVEECE